MTLNPQLDSFNYSNLNNPKARTITLNIIEEHNLIDTGIATLIVNVTRGVGIIH